MANDRPTNPFQVDNMFSGNQGGANSNEINGDMFLNFLGGSSKPNPDKSAEMSWNKNDDKDVFGTQEFDVIGKKESMYPLDSPQISAYNQKVGKEASNLSKIPEDPDESSVASGSNKARSMQETPRKDKP